MELKKQIFGELDRQARPGTLLATNTSTLDVDAIARSTKRPQDVLGTHFFSPANVMRLLEIVRGKATSYEALATAIALGRKLGKVPVVVGNCDGFVGNRMLARRSTESERLLLEGALPQEVDAAVVEFGFPMGPFAMGDLAGLDGGWRIRRARGVRAEISDPLCEAGRFGQKTGKGYYSYQSGDRAPADRQAGDHRADDLPDDQRRRAPPRRGHRVSPGRRRRDLGLRLRLAGVARRPDVPCRPGRARADPRSARALRAAHRGQDAAAGAAAREARSRRQRLRLAQGPRRRRCLSTGSR